MLKPKHILLASHGTPGARAAERAAFALCGPKATLHHLIVVPDFWKGMMGDDWLNNASTRDTYGRYVEGELENEVRRHIASLQRQAAKHRIRYRPEVVFGKPEQCLRERIARGRVDLVVLGAPRPKGKSGLRSYMVTEKLLRALHVPALIVPYPA
ncbi:MAG: universal stress protein [Gammaproteobacteria bacterium]|nr:MAG: universal stress protein [Gammaproteobacteria bacterium]